MRRGSSTTWSRRSPDTRSMDPSTSSLRYQSWLGGMTMTMDTMMRNDYVCKEQSQAEWAHFTDIPSTEPQHPDSPDYRPGVYNSRMFRKPGTEENGIHVIILDNRSQRAPTFRRFGQCKGSETKMMGHDQWG